MNTHPRRAYPTDLNDRQWSRLAFQFPLPPSPRGRPRTWAYREILNAIFYIVRSGEAWRLLPHDFPPWQTAYGYYLRGGANGRGGKLQTALVRGPRAQEGGGAPPPRAPF